MKNKIFHQLKKGKGVRQLICFPYLGGYANSFFDLASKLEDDIEIWAANPPGHGRCAMEPLKDISSLLDLYFEELQEIIKPDCVFFGHSMGGIIAYFLAERIKACQQYSAKPGALVLSACNVPNEFQSKAFSCLSNDDLIKHLMSYGGISDELISEKELLEFFLPIYRADFEVLETAANLELKPIEIPAYFMWGEKDKIVPLPAALFWSNYFKNEINIIPIEDGAHMFIYDKVNIVVEHLKSIMILETKTDKTAQIS